MNRTARTLALAIAGLTLLAGCWTSTDEAEPSAIPATSAAASTTAAADGETSAAADGETDGDAFEYDGVTVTGAEGAEPVITLAEDFAPATELGVVDITEGSGEAVAEGAMLTVHYVGVGQESRAVFDSSWLRGEPATFPLDGVILGWQQGMLGMQPGGRRLLVIPGSMAYGENGSPPVIAPDETLVFVVDLVSQEPA